MVALVETRRSKDYITEGSVSSQVVPAPDENLISIFTC